MRQHMTEGVPGVHRVRGPIDPDATHKVRAEGLNAKLERRHNAEVRAGATNRPEEVRLHLFTRPHEATVGSHELHRCQIVRATGRSALQPPDAAAERQAGATPVWPTVPTGQTRPCAWAP